MTDSLEASGQAPLTQAALERAWVDGAPPTLTGPVVLAEPDAGWPRLFEREAERISAILGGRALRLEHVGSTSVPGLPAKPIIDVDLVVADSADEPAYLPDLVAAGYRLVIREPDWYEHRCFTGPDTDINLHVFSPGCMEVARHLLFRDWLRTHPDERDLYARTKRELASREWTYIQQYAEAKGEVVTAILGRAVAGSGPAGSAGSGSPAGGDPAPG